MCGIAGIVDLTQAGPSRSLAATMTGLLSHRGPDDEGVVVLGPAALGHRRLSILDLSSAGHQPMSTEDGRLAIVFNGEIYNYPEVKAELEGLGETFRTRSDTEALLIAYRVWGRDCLRKLNGMFAFALWDAERQALFAARDRLGKKPFFYHHRPGHFAFASEMKALLADPAIMRDVDLAAEGVIFLEVAEAPPPSPLHPSPPGPLPLAPERPADHGALLGARVRGERRT